MSMAKAGPERAGFGGGVPVPSKMSFVCATDAVEIARQKTRRNREIGKSGNRENEINVHLLLSILLFGKRW